jgi:hypothetical protein
VKYVCGCKVILGSSVAISLTREDRESFNDGQCFSHGGRHDPKEGAMRRKGRDMNQALIYLFFLTEVYYSNDG